MLILTDKEKKQLRDVIKCVRADINTFHHHELPILVCAKKKPIEN